MSHYRKLGKPTDQRVAMLRAMTTYLLENGQIKTTVSRAKEVAPIAEKMITLAKDQGGRGQEAVRRDRPQVRLPQRRLHPRGEDRPPPRRCR